jgi:hypothetical protein
VCGPRGGERNSCARPMMSEGQGRSDQNRARWWSEGAVRRDVRAEERGRFRGRSDLVRGSHLQQAARIAAHSASCRPGEEIRRFVGMPRLPRRPQDRSNGSEGRGRRSGRARRATQSSIGPASTARLDWPSVSVLESLASSPFVFSFPESRPPNSTATVRHFTHGGRTRPERSRPEHIASFHDQIR